VGGQGKRKGVSAIGGWVKVEL